MFAFLVASFCSVAAQITCHTVTEGLYGQVGLTVQYNNHESFQFHSNFVFNYHSLLILILKDWNYVSPTTASQHDMGKKFPEHEDDSYDDDESKYFCLQRVSVDE